ncbi:hypothetical protein SUGI_0824590 [Cryptomeria japonica]|nr:hypothetical protein SUGI_0824590 [Cryptomeria japonica]
MADDALHRVQKSSVENKLCNFELFEQLSYQEIEVYRFFVSVTCFQEGTNECKWFVSPVQSTCGHVQISHQV